jgi:hypothetical protein
MPLSDRIRPNSEAAPWVVQEVKILEQLLANCREDLRLQEEANSNQHKTIAKFQKERNNWRSCAVWLARALNQPFRKPRHSGLCRKQDDHGYFVVDSAGNIVIDCKCGEDNKLAFAALEEFDRLSGGGANYRKA